MVFLLHSRAPKFQGWVSRYVRTVVYENITEIADRLRAKATGRADIRAPALPPGFPTPGGRPIEPENDDDQQKHPDLPEQGVLNPSGGESPVDNDSQEEATVSPEETRAALTIEAAYHCVMARKKSSRVLMPQERTSGPSSAVARHPLDDPGTNDTNYISK